MRQAGTLIDIESLPSLDYAIYLTNTVKFHIAQTYHIFEESHFMRGLLSLYNDGPPPLTSDNRMWYIQYFLVMAMGKGLLTRGMSKAGSPGSEYFLRAMELFPDASGLYQDPILSIEVCCGLALYLQAVDHRNSAYVYVRHSSCTIMSYCWLLLAWIGIEDSPESRSPPWHSGWILRWCRSRSVSQRVVDAVHSWPQILIFDGCSELCPR